MSIHINRSSSTRFQARVRARGCRNYRLIGRPTKSFQIAVLRMAQTFAADSHWKRGDVLVTADYYDPSSCCEITR